MTEPKKYNKGEIELTEYPKDMVMPFGVASGIRAKRCSSCNKIFYTNNNEFKKCRKCKERESPEQDIPNAKTYTE